MKDISWLWRRAYNSAVQGCSEWEGCGDQISELFEIAKGVRPYAMLRLPSSKVHDGLRAVTTVPAPVPAQPSQFAFFASHAIRLD